MITGNDFNGDNHETLKKVQMLAYMDSLREMIYICNRLYADAARAINRHTVLYRKAKELKRFDHYTLQIPHDIIASWYRYKYGDGGQMPVFPEGDSYESHLHHLWRKFFIREIHRLQEETISFARHVMTAICFPYSQIGSRSANELIRILDYEYGCIDWLNTNLEIFYKREE